MMISMIFVLKQEDLHELGSEPIGGAAGDMVIWNQLLPHGSRPNLGAKPRIVQYIKLNPSGLNEVAEETVAHGVADRAVW